MAYIDTVNRLFTAAGQTPNGEAAAAQLPTSDFLALRELLSPVGTVVGHASPVMHLAGKTRAALPMLELEANQGASDFLREVTATVVNDTDPTLTSSQQTSTGPSHVSKRRRTYEVTRWAHLDD